MTERFGLLARTASGTGVLHQLTGVIARHDGDIASVEILGTRDGETSIYFEIEQPSESTALFAELRALPIVRGVDRLATLQMIYGKRIIIMGGGAQVGQVAIGAISEADRHNIRGERISVDTIPLVGEAPLAAAVRAVARLPRASALVLAGALMGGDIERAGSFSGSTSKMSNRRTRQLRCCRRGADRAALYGPKCKHSARFVLCTRAQNRRRKRFLIR